MFRDVPDVPACSWMFRVPGFIDAPNKLCLVNNCAFGLPLHNHGKQLFLPAAITGKIMLSDNNAA